jgi:rhodanese-related sulfurtransferase
MFKTLFGIGGPKVDLGQKIAEGAVIIDVRSPEEYREGHVKGSVNIPLDRIESQLKKLDRSKPVITCCRSGARSGMAADIRIRNGFDCVNGGPWTVVNAATR